MRGKDTKQPQTLGWARNQDALALSVAFTACLITAVLPLYHGLGSIINFISSLLTLTPLIPV